VSTKLSKEDVKSPDQITQKLRSGFEWTAQHSKVLAVALGVFAVIAVTSVAYKAMSDKKDAASQEDFYRAEKQLLNLRAGFELGTNPLPPGQTPPAGVTAQKASGDFEKDFGPATQGLKAVIEEHGVNRKGSKMAALKVSDLYLEFNKNAEAVETLKKVDSSSKDLLSSLIKLQLGTALSNQDKCSEAIQTWDSVLKSSSAKFIHGQAKLKKALCFEKMNETAKAEQLYNEVKAEAKDTSIGRAAESYLRLLGADAQKAVIQ
jgi:tetratricopeptide (TPR) repeat protein